MNAGSRLHVALASCAVALGSAVLLAATSPPIPLGWDEGDTISRAELITSILQAPDAPGQPGGIAGLREKHNWPFVIWIEGHPPLPAIVIALGHALAPESLDPLLRFRLGPILLFALATGAMFYRLVHDYRLWIVGIVAVVVLLTMPRMFVHAHFTTYDGPVTACWVLAWATFVPACKNWRFAPLFGLALGLTLSAKFTGWLAPVPLAGWALLYRGRGGWRALVIGVPVALAVFVALNPPLWSQPLEGLSKFWSLNLSRGDNPGLNITTQFFGRRYNLRYPLPWYNTLVWTAITVSPMALLLGVIGIWTSLRRWRSDAGAMLLVLSWATLMAVRATPFAPPHDGIRLFLPSFAFLAALAGVGAGRALYRDTLLEDDKIVAQGWAKVAIGLAMVMSTYDAVMYFPHGLSYYNRLIGGLRGATALGMEPTYFWDSLDRETLAWLDSHTGPNEKVRFAWGPPHNLDLLKRWRLLKHANTDPGTYRWYVLQRRPGAYRPADAWLIQNVKPAYQRTLFGVPLLDVYPDEAYLKARDEPWDKPPVPDYGGLPTAPDQLRPVDCNVGIQVEVRPITEDGE